MAHILVKNNTLRVQDFRIGHPGHEPEAAMEGRAGGAKYAGYVGYVKANSERNSGREVNLPV
jgi:hypothetical protein